MTTVNASTSLVLVDTTNTSSIVYLSTLQNPGTLITIRDSTGSASANSSIHVSTTVGVSFFDGVGSIGYRITQPYGFLTFTPRTSNVWALVNSFAFPDQTSANVSNVNTSQLFVSSIFQEGGFISSQRGLFSTIGVNCNAPNANYRVDVNGPLNASSFFINGQPLVADGNISTIRTSTLFVNGNLQFVGGTSTFSMSNYGGGVDIMDYVYFASTNRVGIRTSTPNFALDVSGSIFGTSSIAVNAIVNASLTASSVRGTESQISSMNTSSITSLAATTPLTLNAFLTANNRSSNIWVAGGTSVGNPTTQTLVYSVDNGSNWSNSVAGGFNTSAGSNGCKGIAYNGTTWVAVGEGTTGASFIQYSGNGSNWSNTTSQLNTGTGNYVNSVGWNGRVWIAGAFGTSAQNVQISSNAINWFNVSSANFSASMNGVAWNGRYWVGVGAGSSSAASIEYSFDSLTWSNASSGGFSSAGRGIAWNGQLWVAVGADATAAASIKYSYDGSNWSNSFSGAFTTTGGYGVAWNGRMWVAVGNGGSTAASIKYSMDGLNWFNSASGGFTTDGRSVSWSGTRWVATGTHSTAASNIQVSSDGINWSAPTSGTIATVGNAVAYSSNVNADLQFDNLSLFGKSQYPFTVSTNTFYMGNSTLQINNVLTVQNPRVGGSNVGIGTVNPAFTLDVNGTFRAISSFVSSFTTTTFDVAGQAKVSSVYAVSSVGINTSTPFYTLDVNGITNTSSLITNLVRTPATNSNIWVAGGWSNDGSNGILKYSLDNGSNWANATGFQFTNAGRTYCMCYNGQYFIGYITNFLFNGGNFVRSSNGINWSIVTPVTGTTTYPFQIGHNMIWTGRYFIMTGRNNTNSNATIARSEDGLSWTPAASGNFATTNNSGFGIAFNGRRLVAATTASSSSAFLKYSDDQGLNWTSCTVASPFVGGPGGIATNGRIWVAVAQGATTNGSIKYSFDGITFTDVPANGFNNYGGGVAWNGTLFVAVGADFGGNTIKYSYDGINWTNVSTNTFISNGQSVTWSGREFVAVGVDNTAFLNRYIKRSSDGITWTNSTSGADILEYHSVAFSSNVVPDLRIDNLAVYGKAQYSYTTSTNMLHLGTSSITFNSLLTVQNPILGGSNVGINNTNPTATLQVNGSNNNQVLSLQNTSINGIPLVFAQASNAGDWNGLASNGDWVIRTNNVANKLFLTNGSTAPGICLSNGFVGISNANPLALLDIRGGNNNAGTGGRPLIAFQYNDGDGGYRHFVTSRHLSLNGLYSQNAIDFWVNCNASTGGSSSNGVGNVNVMSITGLGVGISNANPTQALDVNGSIRSGGLLLKGGDTLLSDWAVNIISTNTTSQAIIMGYSNNTNNAMDLHYWYTGNGSATNRVALGHYNNGDILNIMASGRIGITHAGPVTKLDVNSGSLSNADSFAVLRAYANNGNAKTCLNNVGQACSLWPVSGGSLLYFYWRDLAGTAYTTTLAGGAFFTGQHGCFVDSNAITSQNINNFVGLIVSSADKGNISLDISGNRKFGMDAIWITEALPIVKLADRDMDKAVFGVISHHANDQYDPDGKPVLDTNQDWGNRLNGRIRVNGLGEGAIWVTNINGNIENGDYICSSVIPGFGRRQDDDILHNYTVAKATMSCTFQLNTNKYKCIELTHDGKKYRKAFIGCTYHCS